MSHPALPDELPVTAGRHAGGGLGDSGKRKMDTGNLLGVSGHVFLLTTWWILKVKMPKFQLATKFLPLHSLQQQQQQQHLNL